jgi:outer membrane receptor protein involved in Fe transport
MHDLLGYASYIWEMPGDQGVLTFNGEIKYSSIFNFDVTGPSQANARPLTPIHGLINASMLYQPNHGNWTVQLWAKNLTDKLYVTYSTNYYYYVDSHAEAGNAAYKNQNRVAYGDPRTFGVTVNYKL